MKQLSTVLLLLLSLASAIPGEAGGLPSASSVRDEIEQGMPGARFERESRIRLGRIALAVIKPVARWALDDDDEARTYLDAIKKIDIATYRVLDLPENADLSASRRIESRMQENGWVKMLRERDDDTNTWVFLRHHKDGAIRGLLVIELDDRELSVVGVEGRIDEILAEAIADEPGEFSGLFGS